MTAVTFTFDGLGPFDGEYHEEGKHLSEARRLTFKTPDGFTSETTLPSVVEISHPDGRKIISQVQKVNLVIGGESYIECLPK